MPSSGRPARRPDDARTVVIEPSGPFTPSPARVPDPLDDPAATDAEDDLDDWGPDLPPVADGRRREITVRHRGQQAGSLDRTQAARLEEELRRRFLDRLPGGAP